MGIVTYWCKKGRINPSVKVEVITTEGVQVRFGTITTCCNGFYLFQYGLAGVGG